MGIFQQRLIAQVGVLDQRIPPKTPPDQREEQVLELCAWAHGEVVFVHPFADGNGRMARALIVWLTARYGLPVFLDLRPRPGGPSGYATAARASMTGRHQLMQIALTKMLADYRTAQQAIDSG
jgi:fido (protein-threonine AMPylation protein)